MRSTLSSPCRTLFVRLCLGLCSLGLGFLLTSTASISAQNPPAFDLAKTAYRVFPENKPGNALYWNNNWLFSNPDCTIKDWLAVSDKNLIVWCTGKKDSSLVSLPSQAAANYVKTEGRYWVDPEKMVLIYADQNDVLHNVPLKFRSAAGFLPNNAGVLAMYHTVKTTLGDDGVTTYYQYQVHIFKEASNDLQSFPNNFVSDSPKLSMKWENDRLLVVRPDQTSSYQFSIP